MRVGHRQTWLRWINELSPMSSKISNYPLEDRRAMAEALAFAAPDGPSGMRCEDGCCENEAGDFCADCGRPRDDHPYRHPFKSALKVPPGVR